MHVMMDLRTRVAVGDFKIRKTRGSIRERRVKPLMQRQLIGAENDPQRLVLVQLGDGIILHQFKKRSNQEINLPNMG